MATPKLGRRTSTPRMGYTEDSTLFTDDGTPSSVEGHGVAGATHPRRSFVSRLRRASRASLWKNLPEEEELVSPSSERPPIPSALAPSGEIVSSPLPILPMIVLSIVRLRTLDLPSLPLMILRRYCWESS